MNNELIKRRGRDKEKLKTSQKKYMAKVKQYQVILHPDRDGDIIIWLTEQENKQRALREAIRRGMR